jgi:hypothetical protein
MGLADFGNNAVVMRHTVPGGTNLNGVAPTTTPTLLVPGRKLLYPVDANGGGFEFNDAYSYIVWGIRLSVPGATRYDIWVRNEAGDLFLLDSNLAWGGSLALENSPRVHLTGGDDLIVTTQGAVGAVPGVAEVVFDLWGPATMPY